MGKKIFILILSIIPIFFYSKQTGAYSSAAHKQITINVIDRNAEQLSKYLKDIGLTNGVDELLDKKKLREWIEDGSWKEDYNWVTIFDPLYSHFYNPLTNKSGVGGDSFPSAYEWADAANNSLSWKKTRDYFYKGLILATKTEREKALANAFKALGHVIHLLEEVSVPAHTRGDLHAGIFPVSLVVGKDLYEKYTNDNRATLNYTLLPFTGVTTSISSGAPKQLWDYDAYNGENPSSTTDIGLSQYTNANFFSRGTIFRGFPYPAWSSVIEYDEVVNAATGKVRTYLKKVRDGEVIDHLAAGRWFYKYLPPDHKRSGLKLDKKCHGDYAKLLIPRAVGYSAGLLNYFFRGQLDFQYSDIKSDGKIEIAITNLSDELLVKGKFELYYDDKDGNRVHVEELNPSEVTELRKDSPPFKITFKSPNNFDPKKIDYYMLVYNGQLGSEEKAYIGKYKQLRGATPVMAKYVSTENKIFFTLLVAGESSGGHFYIDVASLMNFTPRAPYAIRVLEDRANMGVLVVFKRGGIGTYDFVEGRVLRFKVTTKASPENKVSYGGYDYYKYNYEYQLDQFGTTDSDLMSEIPDCNIELGHPSALGAGLAFGQDTTIWTNWSQRCVHGFPPAVRISYHVPIQMNETSPHNWVGQYVYTVERGHREGYYFIPTSGPAESTYTTATYSEATLTKKGVAKLRQGSSPNFVAGRQIVPIGVMVWAPGDAVEALQWEIYFSLRAEWELKQQRHAESGFSPYTFSICDGSATVSLPALESYPMDTLYHYATVPFIFRRTKSSWAVEDPANVLPGTKYLETRRMYTNEAGARATMGYLVYGDSGGQVQEETVVDWNEAFRTYRWFVPNHVAGRYRKMWGVMNGGTTERPVPLLDYTSVDYSKWSTDWRINRDIFTVKTLLRYGEDDLELPAAASSEDEWSYTWGSWNYYYNAYIDFHSMPPVVVNSFVYSVKPNYYNPGWGNAKPQRVNYKHAGGGVPSRKMLRMCPVKSGPINRSVYILDSTVYDYDQPVPGVTERVSREILGWLPPANDIPKIDSEITYDGKGTIILKHPYDESKNLEATDDEFSYSPNEVCDAGLWH